MSGAALPSFGANVRRIAHLAWPVLLGQLAVVGFSTVDTFFVARYGAEDLAALSVGLSAYVAVFIGFMGMVLALGPIVAQHFGARRLQEAGAQLHQAVWVALALAAVGSLALIFPDPFLSLSQAPDAVQAKARQYLQVLALSLPAALLFSAYRGFNNAVSRPKAVMALQLAGFAAKIPLSALLIFGLPAWGLPAMGVVGCAVATCICMWGQVLGALWVLRRDPFYNAFHLRGQGLHRPQRAAISQQLRLGVPMGMSILVEVTGFSFMALFIARMGTTPLAAHQIAANLVSVLFMVPLAIGSATGTLVGQRIGAQDQADARRIGWHGLRLGLMLTFAAGLAVWALRPQVIGLYTPDAAVAAACLPLLAWVLVFHMADGAQTIATFILRAYRVVTFPMVILAVALWGVGLGGGYLLAFNPGEWRAAGPMGAPGYWMASTAALVLAAAGLCALVAWLARGERRRA